MKKIFLVILVLFLAGCSSQNISNDESNIDIKYHVDVTQNEDDLFHVTVYLSNLSSENNIYNFAATAPGTYQILDYGRFVRNFKAFNKKGNLINSEQISTNRWKIYQPTLVSKIVYDVEDTFDSEIETNLVAPMSGTGIEDNYISMNTFGVLGYFEGLQSYPVKVKISCKDDWKIGTALIMQDDGYYNAENFDHLADSPFLMGELTIANIKINNIDVSVYSVSADTNFTAPKILSMAEDVLNSSADFLTYDPVPNYCFLMVLPDMATFQRNRFAGAGALEHSYSSLYVMPAHPQILGELKSTMAHEFMHILSPLNLHSEIVHTYNFIEPTPSKHIWLYEGVTEWVSDIMQLRSGLITEEEYLHQISLKLIENERFDSNLSLVDVSRFSYREDGYKNFLNFYNKGAVVAAMLDIRLLELSQGERGLREVYIDLLKKYGKYKPFPEDNFFEILVEETYPEIEEFINKYIRGTEPLPYKEYFSKIGYKYIQKMPSEDKRPMLGVDLSMNDKGQILAMTVKEEAKSFGIEPGDIVLNVFDKDVSAQNISEIAQEIYKMEIGTPYLMTVLRNNEEIQVSGKLLKRYNKHVFVKAESPEPEQIILREQWLSNQQLSQR